MLILCHFKPQAKHIISEKTFTLRHVFLLSSTPVRLYCLVSNVLNTEDTITANL